MSDQLFEHDEAVEIRGKIFECVAVSYQEPNGERQNYGYTFRLKSEVDAEREAAAKALEGEESAPEENQPEQPQEETLNVR